MLKRSLIIILFACAGCFQTSSDSDYRTVPVTNNPHVVPNHGGGLPGMGSGPY